MPDNNINPLEIIRKSTCYNCKHRLTRIIEPATQEDIDYYMEYLDIAPDDTYDLYIEQNKCLITDEDIDGIIRSCSKFEPTYNTSLIRDYKF